MSNAFSSFVIDRELITSASLYIHVPFCKSRCLYCDFYSSTQNDLIDKYIAWLVLEIQQRKDFLPPKARIKTLYFGGGTPSLLTALQLEKIFRALDSAFFIEPDAEITFEVNPDDITGSYASVLKNAGVNRISMGAQSFSDKTLAFLKRRHNSALIKKSVAVLRTAGFINISLDLIAAIRPGLAREFRMSLRETLLLAVPHLSVYLMTPEKDTPLGALTAEHVSDAEAVSQYYAAREVLSTAGYEHYEISNYARPGYRSRHNLAYWQRQTCLGLGPGAHSYKPEIRSYHQGDLVAVLKAADPGKTLVKEYLKPEDIHNEFVMLGLRTAGGLACDLLDNSLAESARKLVSEKKLYRRNNRFYITPAYLIQADALIRELFL